MPQHRKQSLQIALLVVAEIAVAEIHVQDRDSREYFESLHIQNVLHLRLVPLDCYGSLTIRCA